MRHNKMLDMDTVPIMQPLTPPHVRSPGPQNAQSVLDQLRDRIRMRHYSIRTEHAYVDWVRRYIAFHGHRHPLNMGPQEVTAFLTHLAVIGGVAASTQNQAKSALLFLYRDVLGEQLFCSSRRGLNEVQPTRAQSRSSSALARPLI